MLSTSYINISKPISCQDFGFKIKTTSFNKIRLEHLISVWHGRTHRPMDLRMFSVAAEAGQSLTS